MHRVTLKQPIKVYSLNQLYAMPWRKRHKISQTQKNALYWAFNEAKIDPAMLLPCKVTLTRYGPRKLDLDNLAAGFKSIRDYIAVTLFPDSKSGQMDDSDQITWHYEQKTAKEYGVMIEITQVDPSPPR
jgi:hypothetical protein